VETDAEKAGFFTWEYNLKCL